MQLVLKALVPWSLCGSASHCLVITTYSSCVVALDRVAESVTEPLLSAPNQPWVRAGDVELILLNCISALPAGSLLLSLGRFWGKSQAWGGGGEEGTSPSSALPAQPRCYEHHEQCFTHRYVTFHVWFLSLRNVFRLYPRCSMYSDPFFLWLNNIPQYDYTTSDLFTLLMDICSDP
jgi:hypothetical protein